MVNILELQTVMMPQFDTTKISNGIPVRITTFREVPPDPALPVDPAAQPVMVVDKVSDGIINMVDEMLLRIVTVSGGRDTTNTVVYVKDVVAGKAKVEFLEVPPVLPADKHIVSNTWVMGLIAAAQLDYGADPNTVLAQYLTTAPYEVV